MSCPVSLSKKLLSLLPDDESSVFPVTRRIVCSKNEQKFHEFLGISYSTARDVFKKHVSPFVQDVSKYWTHSIKSGAASNKGCRGLSGDLIDKHAGWKNPRSKHRYIKYSKEDLLSVSGIKKARIVSLHKNTDQSI